MSDVTTAYTPQNRVECTANDLPLAAYKAGLQLELVRYDRRGGRTRKHPGWVHPVNGTTPPLSGVNTRGGRSFTSVATTLSIFVLRQTEWPIAGQGQVVDVTAGMWAWMAHMSLPYRSPGAPIGPDTDQTTECVTYLGMRRRHTIKVPYGWAYRGFAYGRFAFRWSVVDQADPRGRRISGPLSEQVVIGQTIAPLVTIGAVDGKADAQAVALEATGASWTAGRAWLGRRNENKSGA